MGQRVRLYDSIKGIAIFGIFMVHMQVWFNIFPAESIVCKLVQKGSFGVELSYLMNAFFFSHTYEKQVRQGDKKPFEIIKKMIIKIMPVYYCGLLMQLLFVAIGGGQNTSGRFPILYFFC